MRRADKEITDAGVIEDILNKADVIRIAMVDDGEPYIVAMNHVYLDKCIYLHSAKEGRKIDLLKKNNRIAFQADTDVEILLREETCSCTTRYRSVVGTGNVALIDDTEVKKQVLDAIMKKHTGREGFEYSEKSFERTLIIKIDIDSMTGKNSGF